MSKSFSVLSTVVAAMTGGAMALAVTHLWPKEDPRVAPSPESAEREVEVIAAEPSPTRTVRMPQDSARLASIEDELARLKEAARATDDVEPSDVEPPVEELSPREYVAALDEAFESDEGFNEWSARASGLLTASLEALGDDLEFNVIEADCRSERCRATVEWPDYQQASETGGLLAERPIEGLDCTQTIVTPEPDDDYVPYTASLYLDCGGT